MAGVRADVTALVVGVQDEVETSDIVVGLIDPHHVGEVAAEVEIGIRLDDRGLPVVHLVDALLILLHEHGVALHR